jgi:hypothetical protein
VAARKRAPLNANVREHMPSTSPKLFAAVALVALSASAAAQPERTFLSWYNGWGSHQVWGVGRVVGSSYANASVKCGETEIKVVPIYDSHSATQPPNQKQSSAFASSHNVALAQELAKKGVQCAFEKEPKGK